MKAFLSAMAALVVIAFGANWVLNDYLHWSSADRAASSSVRLGE